MGKGIASKSFELRARELQASPLNCAQAGLKTHAVISTVAPGANKRPTRRAGLRWGGSAGGFTISWAFSPRDYADGSAPPYPPEDRIACNSLELRALCHQFNGRSSTSADKMGGLGGEATVAVWPKASRRSGSEAPHHKQSFFAERAC